MMTMNCTFINLVPGESGEPGCGTLWSIHGQATLPGVVLVVVVVVVVVVVEEHFGVLIDEQHCQVIPSDLNHLLGFAPFSH